MDGPLVKSIGHNYRRLLPREAETPSDSCQQSIWTILFFLDRRGVARPSGGSASAADILYGSNVVVTYMAMEQCK